MPDKVPPLPWFCGRCGGSATVRTLEHVASGKLTREVVCSTPYCPADRGFVDSLGRTAVPAPGFLEP